MTSFYQFQRQFPDDEACLRQIMISRYGGLELDCPACGAHGKFYRMARDRAYECQHCRHHELLSKVGDGGFQAARSISFSPSLNLTPSTISARR